MRVCLAVAAASLFSGAAALAQPAPRETLTAATPSGKKVVIEYGRPALRGRKLDELLAQLPPNRVWRAGVDQVTTLNTEADLTIGDKRIPAGKYTVYMHIPATGDWSMIVNRDPGVELATIFPQAPADQAHTLYPRLDDYDKVVAQEVARIPLKAATPAQPMERFLIGLAPFTNGASSIAFTWDARSYMVPVQEAAGTRPPPPPRASRGTASAMVGGKKVTIEYGRPLLRGRSLPELLSKLPPDRIWRAGENQVTILTAEGDLMVGSTRVPAGKYSVYLHAPETGDWSLVLNRDPGIELIKIFPQAPAAVAHEPWPRLDGYDKIVSTEVVRAPMRSASVTTPVDPFAIALDPSGPGAKLTMTWADRSWTIDLRPAR